MGLADNDVTRMTRHQLAARIEQMEATAKRNCTVGAPRDRHRQGEDIRRREKIADYKAELDRRIRNDEMQARADARLAANEEERDTDAQARTIEKRAAEIAAAHGPAAAAGYRSVAEATYKPEPMRPPLCAECAKTGRTAYACTGLTTGTPLCARHGAAAAAAKHTAEQTTTPAATASAPKEPMISNADYHRSFADARQQQAEQQHNEAPDDWRTSDREAKRRDERQREIADAEYSMSYEADRVRRAEATEEIGTRQTLPSVTVPRPTPVIAPPPDPHLQIACPQCFAEIGERCRNYKGQNCHPHGKRKLPAQADADARLAKHQAKEASEKRRATVAAAHEQTAAAIASPRPTPTPAKMTTAQAIAEIETAAHQPEPADLDAAVEALVKRYSCGRVIDAAWEASARLFKRA